MRIESIKIRDIMGISLDFSPNRVGITAISGPNGSGKSRVLLAIQMALCGRMGCLWPDKPLSKGKEAGGVAIRLVDCNCLMEPSHLDAMLQFETIDGVLEDSLAIMDSTGEFCPEPRTTLRRLRDTSDLEVQSPFHRMTYDHSEAILAGLEALVPREFRTYICTNGSCLDYVSWGKLEAWAVLNQAQVITEVHEGSKVNRKIDIVLP